MQQTNILQHGIKIRVLFLLSLQTRKQAKTCKYRQRASNLLDCSFSLAHSFFIFAIYSSLQTSIPTSLCNSEICLFFSLISVFRSFKTVSYRFTNSLSYITQTPHSNIFPIFLCALDYFFLLLHKLLVLHDRFLRFFSLHNFGVGLAKQGCHFLKTFFVACLESQGKTKQSTFASVSLSINSLLSSACS